MAHVKMGGRPRGPSDAELRSLCEAAEAEFNEREDFQASSFIRAAKQFSRDTRVSNRAARRLRIEAGETGGSYEGDISFNDVSILECLIALQNSQTSARIITLYTGLGDSTVRKGVARLASAGMIVPESHTILWARFGAQHYDAEMGARQWDVMGITETIVKQHGAYVLPVVAAFGHADLTIDHVAQLCGIDGEEAEEAIAALRRASLINPASLEVDRHGILGRLAPG